MPVNVNSGSDPSSSEILANDHHRQLQQFLRFHLLPSMTAVMPAGQLTEVLKVPLSQITPIPHLPEWVFGVYNWRGEILWLVDLGNLLGLTSWHQQENPPSLFSFIVLDAYRTSDPSGVPEHVQLGLLVNRVEDIEWLNTDQLQSPPSTMVTERLAPFLCGYWLSADGDTFTLLDGDAIFDRMPT